MRTEAVMNRFEFAGVRWLVQRVVEMLRARVAAVRAPRQLKVAEAVPLGEKRYVAVVQFEHKRFLVGSAPSSLVMLARLDDTASMPDLWATSERGQA